MPFFRKFSQPQSSVLLWVSMIWALYYYKRHQDQCELDLAIIFPMFTKHWLNLTRNVWFFHMLLRPLLIYKLLSRKYALFILRSNIQNNKQRQTFSNTHQCYFFTPVLVYALWQTHLWYILCKANFCKALNKPFLHIQYINT